MLSMILSPTTSASKHNKVLIKEQTIAILSGCNDIIKSEYSFN